MKIIWRLYSLYVYLVFIILAVFVLPIILLISIREEWHRAALSINTHWANVFFLLIFNPVRTEYRFTPDPNQLYIFCANHFSYLDIPVIARLQVPFKYIGKRSVSKVPIFGLMFRRLHIMVERESLKSRAESLIQCMKALKSGYNLVVFPEGGILTKESPTMVRFKDGAFRLSVQENIPIVPVTMPNNFLILPDDGNILFRMAPCRMIVHEPLFPEQFQFDPEKLKNETYRVISEELSRHHPEKLTVLS